MKVALGGALAGAVFVGLGLLGAADIGQVRAVPASSSATTELITLSATLPDGGQQLTVIDPRSRSLSVYHISAGGELSLKSARSMHWDLQVMHFNNTGPTPPEIRSLLEQR